MPDDGRVDEHEGRLGDELAECGEGQREYAAVCGSVTGAGRAGGRRIG